MITKERMAAVLIIIAVLAVIFIAGCARRADIDTDLAEYVHEVTGIETEDLCIEEFGSVKTGKGDSRTAGICLVLENGGLEKARLRIESAGNRPVDKPDMIGSIREDDPVSLKFKSETAEVKAEYWFLLDGFNGAKSRTVRIYLTVADDGSECLYMFD